MNLERLLQIGMAALALLGALVLGMGQQDPKLPVLGAIAAVSSVVLTDALGWLRLRGAAANVAALAAVGACAWDIVGRYGDETRLLALANVLVYLQIVLLYQPKIIRRYWLIAALSLLQVAVAAALNLEIAFGGLLLVYLFAAITSLTLLHVHTLYVRHGGYDGQWTARRASAVTSPPALTGIAAGRDGPIEAFSGSRLASPLSLVRRWRFGFELLRMCVVTLLLTAIVFPLVPRVGSSALRRADATTTAVTGYTETVAIGEAASISESPEAVMRVRFMDRAGAAYLLHEEPMLKGSWLATYRDGQWLARSENDDATDRFSLRPPQVGAELVRQQITIEPFDSNVLFGVWPVFVDEHNSTNDLLRYDRFNQRLLRPTSHRHEQMQYTTITTGFQGRQALDVVPAFVSPGRSFLERHLLQFPADALPTLVALADELVADVPPEDTVARARRLEGHFLNDGRYLYTLSPTRRDASLDPVEDFMRNTRQGHCEYYATALTLMLRRVGIPSRMVVGYKGGEWNSYGEFYLVRQLHAHAWVEAYVDRLPPDLPQQGADPDAGGWLRLDPTPGRVLPTGDGGEGVAASMRQVFDYLQFLWASYVVRLDAGIQFQEIYLPIRNAVLALFDPAFWQDLYGAIAQFLREGRFSWPAAAATFLIGVTAVAAYRFARWTTRHVVRFLRRRRRDLRPDSAANVEFYRRFTSLLQRLGLRRGEAQTPRDFALETQAWLTAHGAAAPVALAPSLVVDAYYHVRYGNRPLDSGKHSQVEQALRQLEEAVADMRQARSS